ncbi:MAG: 30S ribosomal protein S2, partial [Anaerolineales bacterium]|nr:30S ribosomal protein S2 [Anaerolineales bacterium]
FDLLKKRERLRVEREVEKLNLRLGGIRDMTKLPDVVFVVDVMHEETAVREANILGVPVIGVVDTNCDPDPIDFIIPSNDDAIRAIKLLVSKMADAALEGLAMHKETAVDEEVTDLDGYTYGSFDEDASDEDLLGASTLAKLREADDEEAPAEEVEEAAETEEESE